MNGVTYTWDNNGNLLNDGVNTYTYDSANRLKSITQGGNTSTFGYNGLGDRLTQNGGHYTLDLNAGLTQVLNEGTNTYLYGVDRIAQISTGTEYFLGDALGSVRQMTNASAQITYARAYDPYGVVASTGGASQTSYGFTGEYTDPSGLVYLRARYYQSDTGRFFQKDPSGLEQNTYQYASANPVNFSDPSGLLFWYFPSGGSRAELLGNPGTYKRGNDFAHAWIEYWVEDQNGFWNTQGEFPGGNKKRIDLIVFDRVNSPGFNSSPVDFGVPVTGSVFEIEPAETGAIIKGYGEILEKEAKLSSGAEPYVHYGFLPMKDHWPVAVPGRSIGRYAGKPYSWSTVTWQMGTSLSPSAGIGPVRVDPNAFGMPGVSGIPNAYWAMVVVPGLILYQDERTLERAAGVGAPITAAFVAKYFYDKYKRAQRLPKGGTLPEPGWTPGYAQLELQSVDPSDLLNLNGTCSTPNSQQQLFPWLNPLPIPWLNPFSIP